MSEVTAKQNLYIFRTSLLAKNAVKINASRDFSEHETTKKGQKRVAFSSEKRSVLSANEISGNRKFYKRETEREREMREKKIEE